MTIWLLQIIQGNTVQTGIELFVFNIDRFMENGLTIPDQKALDDFMSKQKCIIITRHINEWKQICPNAQSFKQWKFNLPTPGFQQALITEFNIEIEDIAYVSDDLGFIVNALGSFSTTLFISTDGIRP